MPPGDALMTKRCWELRQSTGTLRLTVAASECCGPVEHLFVRFFQMFEPRTLTPNLESNMFHALLSTTAPWTLFSLIIVSAWIAAGGFQTVPDPI